MLIIVAMIAALVAIGYPYFRGVMEKNKENADIAAMHSAEALMETAYNTRLIIGTKSATEAKATSPLYYDPSGKLVWKRPAPYGQGTDGNQGVTWSCCGDYAYNPANDYRQGVIVCYYTPEGNNNPYPGIHVHWDCDGGGTITPDPVPKPTKPVFPERPTTGPTEGPTDPTTAPNPDPDPDLNPDPEPGGAPSNVHIYPTLDAYGRLEGEILAGHRYRSEDGTQIYLAKWHYNIGDTVHLDNEFGFVPLNKPKSTDGKYPQVFYSSKNLRSDNQLAQDNTITGWDGANMDVALRFGDYFVKEPTVKTEEPRYFVFTGAWYTTINNPSGGPILGDGSVGNGWTEINMRCEICKQTAGLDHFWE